MKMLLAETFVHVCLSIDGRITDAILAASMEELQCSRSVIAMLVDEVVVNGCRLYLSQQILRIVIGRHPQPLALGISSKAWSFKIYLQR